jgi:hypothetical protein
MDSSKRQAVSSSSRNGHVPGPPEEKSYWVREASRYLGPADRNSVHRVSRVLSDLVVDDDVSHLRETLRGLVAYLVARGRRSYTSRQYEDYDPVEDAKDDPDDDWGPRVYRGLITSEKSICGYWRLCLYNFQRWMRENRNEDYRALQNDSMHGSYEMFVEYAPGLRGDREGTPPRLIRDAFIASLFVTPENRHIPYRVFERELARAFHLRLISDLLQYASLRKIFMEHKPFFMARNWFLYALDLTTEHFGEDRQGHRDWMLNFSHFVTLYQHFVNPDADEQFLRGFLRSPDLTRRSENIRDIFDVMHVVVLDPPPPEPPSPQNHPDSPPHVEDSSSSDDEAPRDAGAMGWVP